MTAPGARTKTLPMSTRIYTMSNGQLGQHPDKDEVKRYVERLDMYISSKQSLLKLLVRQIQKAKTERKKLVDYIRGGDNGTT